MGNLSSVKDLKKILILLPPLNEQKRIVSKIEELFSKIDSIKQSLEHTKLQLEQYRSSLLKSAFEGKLTENWRTKNSLNVEPELIIIRKLNSEKLQKKSESILEIPENISKLYSIPENWAWVRLGFLSKLITKGSSPKWQGIKYVDDGILFITSENVGTGKILLTKPKFLEEQFNDIAKRSILQKWDILTNIVGASIGRTAIYDLTNIANINQAVALIRIHDMVNRKYIQHMLNSPTILHHMFLEKVDVARANLSLQNVSDFPIPLTSIKEQEQIVSQIEQGFSLIQNTTQIVESSLQNLQTMKMSVLKQAFEGKLVPQDPNDEPASVLLEKIKLKN
jgi:type I restriction enzyme, S subunit